MAAAVVVAKDWVSVVLVDSALLVAVVVGLVSAEVFEQLACVALVGLVSVAGVEIGTEPVER